MCVCIYLCSISLDAELAIVGNIHRFSKAFALTWYRALTWHYRRLSSPRTHSEPWKAAGTRGGGLPCCPVTSSGTSGAANARAGEQYQVTAQHQVKANALLCICNMRACMCMCFYIISLDAELAIVGNIYSFIYLYIYSVCMYMYIYIYIYIYI